MSVYGCNMNLELQQRAVEYHSVIRKHDNLREGLFEQMPAIELKSTYNPTANEDNNEDEFQTEEEKKKQQEKFKEDAAKTLIDIFSDDNISASAAVANPGSDSHKPLSDLDFLGPSVEPSPTPTVARPAAAQPPGNDLDSLFSFNTPAAPMANKTTAQTNSSSDIFDIFSNSSSHVETHHKPPAASSALDDLFGGPAPTAAPINRTTAPAASNPNDLLGLFSTSTSSSSVATSNTNSLMNGFGKSVSPSSAAQSQQLTAYDKNDVKLVFEPMPNKPITIDQCHIQMKAHNNSIGNTVREFSFSAAAPKSMQLQLNPPNTSVIQPLDSIALNMVISNPKKVSFMHLKTFL